MKAGIRDSGFGIRKSVGHNAMPADTAVHAFPNPQSPIPNPLASEGGEP